MISERLYSTHIGSGSDAPPNDKAVLRTLLADEQQPLARAHDTAHRFRQDEAVFGR